MTFELTRNTFITISIIHLLNHIAYGEINVPPPTIATTATTTTTATASTMRKQTNRFLTPFFRKYGSRGTISFEVSSTLFFFLIFFSSSHCFLHEFVFFPFFFFFFIDLFLLIMQCFFRWRHTRKKTSKRRALNKYISDS